MASEVAVITGKSTFRWEHLLRLLSDALPGKAFNLPSWVPDWSSHNFDDGSTVDTSTTRDEGQYQADGHQSAQVRFNDDDDDAEFTTPGIIFDQLCLILLPTDNFGQHKPNLSQGGRVFFGCRGRLSTP
ncbi:hypothetical protein CEP53_011971 [Fusarium sp. AF-6]|nr:hypothetical protein CEP53_011971 [Fusarium sp. AF-6]